MGIEQRQRPPVVAPAPARAHEHSLAAPGLLALLAASARTLDRLIPPLRVQQQRRNATGPGSILRQSIPIRGLRTEERPGWLEMDTVALCGGGLDDLHLWMLDAVDIGTDWTELRALQNRGERSTVEQIADLECPDGCLCLRGKFEGIVVRSVFSGTGLAEWL